MSQQIIDVLLLDMITAENRRLKGILNKLALSHRELTETAPVFLYMGALYSHESTKIAKNAIVQTLHPSLSNDMRMFLFDYGKIKADMQLFKQALYVLLRHCVTPQQCRDCLPDFLANTVPELHALNRSMSFEEAVPEKVRNQLKDLIQQMQVYVMGRLLY